MASTVQDHPAVRQPVLPDIGRPQMAKANVRCPDIAPQVAIGGAIQRAVSLIGWSNKEAAAKVSVDDAEFGKWVSGARRPQLDKLWAVEALRGPLVIAFAEAADDSGVVVTTSIKVRRRRVR